MRITIDSAGPWTYEQVEHLIEQSAMDLDRIGPNLTVKVQDVYPSQTTTGVSRVEGAVTSINIVIYLKGVSSSFADRPNAIAAHEFGHAWSAYHLFVTNGERWDGYLNARGLAGSARLDSSYNWGRREIIADDYRLLFGSPVAIAQLPNHLNNDIPEPSDVPGLRSYLERDWRGQA